MRERVPLQSHRRYGCILIAAECVLACLCASSTNATTEHHTYLAILPLPTTDPEERHDLASTQPQILAELQARALEVNSTAFERIFDRGEEDLAAECRAAAANGGFFAPWFGVPTPPPTPPPVPEGDRLFGVDQRCTGNGTKMLKRWPGPTGQSLQGCHDQCAQMKNCTHYGHWPAADNFESSGENNCELFDGCTTTTAIHTNYHNFLYKHSRQQAV